MPEGSELCDHEGVRRLRAVIATRPAPPEPRASRVVLVVATVVIATLAIVMPSSAAFSQPASERLPPATSAGGKAIELSAGATQASMPPQSAPSTKVVPHAVPSALPASVTAARAATPTVAPSLGRSSPSVKSESAALTIGPTAKEELQAAEEKLAAGLAEREALARETQAKQEHQNALEAARQARTVAERQLAQQLSRVREVGLKLAEIGADLAQERKQEADRAQLRITRESDFYSRANDAGVGGPKALDLFRELDGALATAHRAMRKALATRQAGTALPDYKIEIAPDPGDPDLRERYIALSTAHKALTTEGDKIAELEARLSSSRAVDVANEVLRLGRIRSLLVPKLSIADRDELVGLGRRGRQAMRRELDHTSLVLRWTPSAWRQMILPSQPGDAQLEALGTTTIAAGELLLLLILYLFVRAKWRGWLATAGPLLASEVNNVALRQIVGATLRLLHALGDELLIVAIVHAAGSMLVGDTTPPELAALYAVAVTWAWYRLILQATHRYLRSAAHLRGVDLTAEAEERIISSLRLAGRYSFGVVAAVVFVDHVVGAGFLATWLRRFFWVGATAIVVVLLRRWRSSITSTYLDNFPAGKLADLVRQTQHSAAGTLFAVVAFGYVAVRGITLYFRDVAMRFEHTRRVLAYLFRLRLERHVDKLGTGHVQPTDLPASVVSAFSESNKDVALVDGWPGMETTIAAVQIWLNGGAAPDVLVHGPRGVGRSTWLQHLSEQVEERLATSEQVEPLRIVRIDLTRRVTSEQALCRQISAAIGEQECSRIKELLGVLRKGPRFLFLVDDVQLLMLRSMDGLAAIRAFSEIVVGTLEHSMWICTSTSAAWRFFSSIMRGRNVFARTIELPSWDEDRIRDLVVGRMKHAGVTAVYDDLVVDQLDTGLAEGLRAAERFHRLLWDHADGNPREAVRVWLRSLVPDAADRVRVRLFSAANPDDLEQLGTLSRFVLAAIVQHDYITVDEAARALGEPTRDCRMTLAWMATQGFVASHEGQYRVTPTWQRAAVRYLKRKHLAFN